MSRRAASSIHARRSIDRISVSDACSHAVVTLRDDQRISEVHALVPTHQGFPVVDRDGRLLGRRLDDVLAGNI